MPSQEGASPRSSANGAAAGRIEAELRAQAAAYPRLTAEEEAELFARGDDPLARERLVEHNLDLVAAAADSHRDLGLNFADLYQEGTVGLLDAVGAYGGRGGFREFAALHIGLQMDALLESESVARREDESAVVDSRTLDTATILFRNDNKRDPSEEEMAALLGWEPERVRRIATILDVARERNDATIVNFLDDHDELDTIPGAGDDEPDADPYRRLAGHGPDE